MSKKPTWIKVHSNILEPKHQKAIGERIWLFLYLIDNADWKTGIVPEYKDADAATELGRSKRTVERWRQDLANLQYITSKQVQRSQEVTIHNWRNPKEVNADPINVHPDKGTQFCHDESIQGTQHGTQHGSQIRVPSQVQIEATTQDTKHNKDLTTIADAGAPPPAAEPKPLTEWQQKVKAMAQALCEVAVLDFAVKANEKTAGQVAAPLLKIGYTPDDVQRFKVLWYQREFPGGKRDRIPPSLRTINKYMGWTKEQPATAPGKTYEVAEEQLPNIVPFREVELTDEQKQAAADFKLWELAYGQMSLSVPREAFDTWVKGARYVERRGDTFIFETRTPQAYDWLTQRLHQKFVDALSAVVKQPVEVVFTLANAPTPEKAAA